jgi:hypothetical protein
MKRMFLIVAALSLTAVFTGCKKDNNSKTHTFYGTPANVGNGTVSSYVAINSNGTPQSLGFTFTKSMLDGLPDDGVTPTYMTMLNLPPQAAITGFDHLELDWNPRGHEPEAIYGLPHFDFHAYIVSMDELMQIVPGPDNTPVDPKYVPQDYVSGVIAVPNMGVHWLDMTSPEFNGQTFTTTYIYGFYHGNMIFGEPMITLAYLQSNPNVVLDIKQPAEFQKPGYYPTKYRISYDAKGQQYFVSLEGLVKH